METQRSKRASLDRQTQLAHLKLVSKYYGYSNYSYPKPENTPTQNPYRRAGHSYPGHQTERTITLEKRTSEPYHHAQPPASPTRRRIRPSLPTDRTSFGSEGSAPSLIDDKTDSEISHDDDYQYHASTSQIWDSFWVAQNGEGAKVRPQVQQRPVQSKKEEPQESSTTTTTARYPALIPSPHIKRTKKTSIIQYVEETVPPRPVEYNITVRKSEDNRTTRPSLPAQFPATTTTEEKRRTIRTVKSSYSLFPKQVAATPAPPPVPVFNASKPTPPLPTPTTRPRTSSLPRPQTPGRALTQRKSSRPQPVHAHSDPLPQIPEPHQAQMPPRPHTSHGPSRPRAATTAARSSADSLPSHLCDPSNVKTTIPLFPSTNLADLVNPRSAPHPPVPELPRAFSSESKTPASRRLFSSSRSKPSGFTLTTQKSFFDFDSDSDSDSSPKHGGIARMMKKSRKSKIPHQAAAVEGASSRSSHETVASSAPRVSAEQIRRRKSRTNLAILTGRKTPSFEDEADVPPVPVRAEGRKSDVFGRMFGRK